MMGLHIAHAQQTAEQARAEKNRLQYEAYMRYQMGMTNCGPRPRPWHWGESRIPKVKRSRA